MTRKRAPANVLRAYLTMAVVAAIPAALASAAVSYTHLTLPTTPYV